MAWTPFKNVLSPNQPQARPVEASHPVESAPAPQPVAIPAKPLSLDAIGQRDELVRQRINAMIDRLDDLRTLQDDFSSILEPIVSISDELPRARMRIAELEASLAQERQAASQARQDGAEIARRLTAMGAELSAFKARSENAESDLRDRDMALDQHRIALRDKAVMIENLERQLFAETERSKSLMSESAALRMEAQAADSALARSEHELMTAREQLGAIEQDNRRVQLLSEEQSIQISDHIFRQKEVEAALDAERQRARMLDTQLAAAVGAREHLESQYDVEVGAYRTELAALTMKLEAATSRVATTDQILAQLRNQLRERDEAHRIAERNFKDANIARASVERRFDALQIDLTRQAERFHEIQRIRTELDARCDMLSKALAAKDAAVEQATLRNSSLNDRIDQLTAKHELSRAELELAMRRLTEELENERSERTLLQGALDIARESRGALQKQHDALKRAARGWREPEAEADFAENAPGQPGANNVHPFAAPGKAG